ncbi:hypothetical protein VC83_05820 [Pseudogymnoascus destructans]|uniref:Uncharacterized protein n=1 Tax=Pseudogymnoascus destructans TaxID=655981 RepID=A0A177A479_9PEZI|nr:uncharacterized protein VC83_05820 [Pseudogymnoascus destructans]OAF57099.2 hypothetical protein VC83_05820 [Pseudogymnoascus destructans]
MDDDDYDSDELEFETLQNLLASAGFESIEAIINNAAEDRRSSKQMTKQLTFVEASKKTEYCHASGIIDSLPSAVRPRSNEVPAFTWLRGGLRRLIVITTFHFADFRVSKHDSIRMKTMFQQLLNEGRITKEPSRKRCRSGDIMTSTRDTQKIQFLCYSDITIKLVDGDKLENLQADILITMKRRRNTTRRKTVPCGSTA